MKLIFFFWKKISEDSPGNVQNALQLFHEELLGICLEKRQERNPGPECTYGGIPEGSRKIFRKIALAGSQLINYFFEYTYQQKHFLSVTLWNVESYQNSSSYNWTLVVFLLLTFRLVIRNFIGKAFSQ